MLRLPDDNLHLLFGRDLPLCPDRAMTGGRDPVILLKNSSFLEKTARNFNICVTIFAKKPIFQQNHPVDAHLPAYGRVSRDLRIRFGEVPLSVERAWVFHPHVKRET